MRRLLYLVPAIALLVSVLLFVRELYLIAVPLLIAGIALLVALRQQDNAKIEDSSDAG